MLKSLFLAVCFAASLFISNLALAQDHSGHQHNFTPIPAQVLAMSAEREAACAAMEEEKKEPDKIAFGFWGYGHAKAHCMGWIDQLMAITNSYCCGGVTSGECRLTSINMQTREAYLDGMWCAIGVDPVVIEGMDGAYALVCASKTTASMQKNKQCPSVYCKGIAGGS